MTSWVQGNNGRGVLWNDESKVLSITTPCCYAAFKFLRVITSGSASYYCSACRDKFNLDKIHRQGKYFGPTLFVGSRILPLTELTIREWIAYYIDIPMNDVKVSFSA